MKLLKEPKTKVLFLEPEEEAPLLREAGSPIAKVIVRCINTGLRMRSEALTLLWPHIDLKRGLLTVAGAYVQSWNAAAKAVLAKLYTQRSRELVFTQGRREAYKSIREAFNGACDRAGLADVTPHVLRHTFVSWLAIGGWGRSADDHGTRRLRSHDGAAQHSAEAVNKLDAFHVMFHTIETIDPNMVSITA